MPKDKFVVNWDGKQRDCDSFSAFCRGECGSLDFYFSDKDGRHEEVKDWSTFSVHVIKEEF